MPQDGNSRLKIVRHGGYTDSLRSYKIFLDDKPVGTIARNAVLELDIPSGPHKLQAKVDWCQSPPLTIQAAPNQSVEVEVTNHWGAWLALWGVTFGYATYLDLTPVRAA